MASLHNQWNHNSHYHAFILKQLPTHVDQALEIGCGQGVFASHLAQRATHVDAIDRDAEVLKVARQTYGQSPNLRFMQANFMAGDWPSDHYHVVTCLAALHHMPLVPALLQMKRVLRPGGTLVVLGLYRETSPMDYLVSAGGAIANIIYRSVIYRHCATTVQAAPTTHPQTPLAEIRRLSTSYLPNAIIHRHLLWRYSLIWQKPDHR